MTAINQIVQKFIRSQAVHAEAILIFGSYLWKERPNDVDMIVLTDSGSRRYRVIRTPLIRIEVEYIPRKFLDMYLENYHWWYEDWELEVAKFIHGKVVYEKGSVLTSFRRRLINFPPEIHIGLLTHRIGMCVLCLEKMRQFPPKSFMFDFHNILYVKNLSYLALLLKKEFPRDPDIPKWVSKEYKRVVDEVIDATIDINLKEDALKKLTGDSIPAIRKFLLEKGKLQLRYITQYKGYNYIVNTFHLKVLDLEDDVWLESLGEWNDDPKRE